MPVVVNGKSMALCQQNNIGSQSIRMDLIIDSFTQFNLFTGGLGTPIPSPP